MAVKVTTQITYSVPDGHYCNLNVVGKLNKHSEALCRFAVKTKYGYTCALYNEELSMENSKMPLKARSCVKAMCGFKSVVKNVPDPQPGPQIDPATVIKMAIDEYAKVVKQLRNQGYPEAMAEKLAKQYMGGK